MRVSNRWWIAVAGVCLQMALGAAYAWSGLSDPSDQGVRLDYLRSHSNILNQLVFSGMQRVSGRTVE